MNKFIANCFSAVVAMLSFIVLAIIAIVVSKGLVQTGDPKLIIGGAVAFLLLVLVQGLLSTIVASYQLQKQNNEYLAALVNVKVANTVEKIEPVV